MGVWRSPFENYPKTKTKHNLFVFLCSPVVYYGCCIIPLKSSLRGASTTASFCSINSAGALVVLIILYGYKLYIVLLNPHINSKEHFSKTNAKVAMTKYEKKTRNTRL